jgi:hypothetical protein
MGTHLIPVTSRRLAGAPVFEAQRISSTLRLRPSYLANRYVPHQLLASRVQAFPAWLLPSKFIVKALDQANPDW